MNDLKTIHNLDFEVAEWNPLPGFPSGKEFMRFRIGSCNGLWRSTEFSYDILAITNDQPGNGHFNDVLQWFCHSCIRDRRKMRILEVWNRKLKKHLIEKRGFKLYGRDNVELNYNAVKKLIKVLEAQECDASKAK